MQKHAFERRPQQPVRTFAVEGKVAVLVVSDERKALRKRMHANLVRPSGFQFGIKISHRTETLEHRKIVCADIPSDEARTLRSPEGRR